MLPYIILFNRQQTSGSVVSNAVSTAVGNVVGTLGTVVSGNLDGNTVTPSRPSLMSSLSPCLATNGVDQGICLASRLCSYNGGTTSGGGNCRMGLSCCISKSTFHRVINWIYIITIKFFIFKIKSTSVVLWSILTILIGNLRRLSGNNEVFFSNFLKYYTKIFLQFS